MSFRNELCQMLTNNRQDFSNYEEVIQDRVQDYIYTIKNNLMQLAKRNVYELDNGVKRISTGVVFNEVLEAQKRGEFLAIPLYQYYSEKKGFLAGNMKIQLTDEGKKIYETVRDELKKDDIICELQWYNGRDNGAENNADHEIDLNTPRPRVIMMYLFSYINL